MASYRTFPPVGPTASILPWRTAATSERGRARSGPHRPQQNRQWLPPQPCVFPCIPPGHPRRPSASARDAQPQRPSSAPSCGFMVSTTGFTLTSRNCRTRSGSPSPLGSSQEKFAGRLHEPLSDYHALPTVLVATFAGVGFEHGHPRLLNLQKEWVVISRKRTTPHRTTSPHSPPPPP